MKIESFIHKSRRDDNCITVGERSVTYGTTMDDSSVAWMCTVSSSRMPLGMRTCLPKVACLRHADFSPLPPFSPERCIPNGMQANNNLKSLRDKPAMTHNKSLTITFRWLKPTAKCHSEGATRLRKLQQTLPISLTFLRSYVLTVFKINH